jgi:DnaJ homologue, subfamily C, member 28, conserved domain
MSPQRRDAEGRLEGAPSWESLVERQIREAMDGGAFDDLPYQGERLPLEDDSAAGEWAMAYRMLRNAEMAPPWIESDKEARKQLAALEALIERAPTMTAASHGWARRDLARIVAAANQAIARVNSEAPTLRQHRRPLDPVAEAARLEEAFTKGLNG